jgi:phosphate transport system permease protein
MAEKVDPFLSSKLGFLPFFKGYPLGIGFLTAATILAIMIVPFIISVSTEVLSTVPVPLKEGMYALGATRWETMKKIALPFAKSGIFGSIILALARALGETMAVTMVIGNTPQISKSLLDPGYTMAAVIANEFTEATSDSYLSALVAIAFILLLITLLVNAVARWLIWRTTGVK